MDEKPLTKSQRRRRNEKRRKEQQKWWDKKMGTAPNLDPQLEEFFSANSNTGSSEKQDAFERAPAHVVEYGEDHIDLDRGVLRRMTNAASERRTEEKLQRARELKGKYPLLWGKRGAAKDIAFRENAEEGKKSITERTVQKYFKLPI